MFKRQLRTLIYTFMSGGNDVTKCKVESLRLEETSEFCIYGAGADQRGVGGWGGPTYGHKSLQGGAWGQSLALFGAARTGRSGDALRAMQVSQEVVGSLIWASLLKHLDVELLLLATLKEGIGTRVVLQHQLIPLVLRWPHGGMLVSVPAGGEEPQLGPISSLRDCYKAQPRRLQLLFSLPRRDGGGRCQQVAAGLCHKS